MGAPVVGSTGVLIHVFIAITTLPYFHHVSRLSTSTTTKLRTPMTLETGDIERKSLKPTHWNHIGWVRGTRGSTSNPVCIPSYFRLLTLPPATRRQVVAEFLDFACGDGEGGFTRSNSGSRHIPSGIMT